MSVKWNIVINSIRQISKNGIVNVKDEENIADDYEKKFAIKITDLNQVVNTLSGGNQQKVVIAKTLAANSKVIIFDEPTRGIDVEAKQEIYKLMNQLAKDGNAIIMLQWSIITALIRSLSSRLYRSSVRNRRCSGSVPWAC